MSTKIASNRRFRTLEDRVIFVKLLLAIRREDRLAIAYTRFRVFLGRGMASRLSIVASKSRPRTAANFCSNHCLPSASLASAARRFFWFFVNHRDEIDVWLKNRH